MAKKAAKSITVKDLRLAVDKAIHIERDRLVPGTIAHTHPGTIFGMQLASGATIEEANAAAERITKSVSSTAKAAGFKDLKPAVLIRDKLITVGFIGPTQIFAANE